MKPDKEKDTQPAVISCNPILATWCSNPATFLTHSGSLPQSEVSCLLNAMFCFSDFSSPSEYLCLDCCSIFFWAFWDCISPNNNYLSSFLFAILFKSPNSLFQAPIQWWSQVCCYLPSCLLHLCLRAVTTHYPNSLLGLSLFPICPCFSRWILPPVTLFTDSQHYLLGSISDQYWACVDCDFPHPSKG